MDLVTLALAKSYINKRINEGEIVTGATPQQAAQIEQNKTDIADLQTEVDELKESGGSADLTGVVRSVNGKTPDEKGNVEIDVSGSGENVYELPIGGDELGGVKNGGNVVINNDGTMTAPEGGDSYTLPVANSTTLGGVKAQAKTSAMTQPVGVDANGNLYTLPPAQSTTEVDGVKFTNHVGNLYSPDNHLTRMPAVGENVLTLTGGTKKYIIFRAKPKTTYVVTGTYLISIGNWGRADCFGVCTQSPTNSGMPVSQIGFMNSGGHGQYSIVKTNDVFSDNDAYLIWQAPSSSDLTDVAIYEGDSIEGYDTINAYSDLNGTATSDSLAIRQRNLDPAIAAAISKGASAVQLEDIAASTSVATNINNVSHSTMTEIGDSALANLLVTINSAVVADIVNKTQIKLGSHYAHCPSVNVVGGTAYISAFENTESTVDSYVLEGVNTHLYVVDIATMTQTAEYIVAQHGDTVGGLTFAYGSGACQSVMIDDTTLRTVFVAKLQDAEGNDAWHQCYRDFNITTNEFGTIGLCQLLDSEGNSHDFTTANASLYIQALTDTSVNTNIVCQPAKVDNIWYVGCGCQRQWTNMPILTTTDWITFEYWATPEAEGNVAHYEMAILADNGRLYTATRQQTAGTLMVMAVDIAAKKAVGKYAIPDGNPSRPFIFKQQGDNVLQIAHILTKDRLNSSQITGLITAFGSQAQFPYPIVTLPPMVYPSFAECADGDYFVAYMVPYGLYCCKIPEFQVYGRVKAIAIAAKLIELAAGK